MPECFYMLPSYLHCANFHQPAFLILYPATEAFKQYCQESEDYAG